MIKPAKEYPDAVVYTAAHHIAGKKLGITEYQLRGISPGVSKERAEDARAILQEAYEKGYVYIPMGKIPGTEKLDKKLRNALPPGLFVAMKDNYPEKAFIDMLTQRRSVAIAGTRRNTTYGQKVTWRRMDTMQDDILVTAFGFGIAQEATIKALEKKIPLITVLVTGPGECYPYSLKLALQMLMDTPGCAVVTPFFPGHDTSPDNFQTRNLIAALLSQEVFIPQSKLHGNGMDIARKATLMSRNVYAAPGAVDDMHSAGCLQLIAEGTAQLWMPWDLQSYSQTANDLSKED